MRNVTGAVAQGSDFFNRTSEMATFWRDLETDNLLVLAPRRVGKTSVMRKMAEEASSYGFTAVFADVLDAADETHFVQRLYTAILEGDQGNLLWNQVKDSWLGKAIGRVQKIGGAGFSLEFKAADVGWARMGEELADALSKLDGRWLIQVDELPVFVLKLLSQDQASQRTRVREFLYWLRRLRLQFANVRWLLAGSIGLDTVTSRLNIGDSINDLRIATLGAFDPETAERLLAALASEYRKDLGEAVRHHIVTRAGWPAPYYLRLIFHELRDIQGPIRNADVDQAIEKLLHDHNYFDYWRQRLFDELGRPDADYAVTLLNSACRTPEAVSRTVLSYALARSIGDTGMREDRLRYLLDILHNDGYLVEDNRRWRFRSPLLREYWHRRVAPPEEVE